MILCENMADSPSMNIPCCLCFMSLPTLGARDKAPRRTREKSSGTYRVELPISVCLFFR